MASRPDWTRTFLFGDPIPLPGGGELVNLDQARAYVLQLPAAEQRKPHWQRAARALLQAAEHGGPFIWFATTAMITALDGGPRPPEPKPKKRLRIGKRLPRQE